MTWATQTKRAFTSRGAFLKAIETKEVDGEKAAYNEDLLPTEPGKSLSLTTLIKGPIF